MKFRKKPIVIEAFRWDGTEQSAFEVESKLGNPVELHYGDGKFLIYTLEGVLEVSPTDWVIRGVQGEFYPIKEKILLETYDPVVTTE
jgi:hypothetical protein